MAAQSSARAGAVVVSAITLLGAVVALAARPRPQRRPTMAAVVDRVRVPPGRAIVGSNDGEDDERPRREVQVPGFSIDRTEVTWAHYAACVGAGVCPVPGGPGPLRADGSLADPEQGALPVTWVSWAEAERYCRFAGGRLPREIEWERAARGDDGRTFPWGDAPDCARANWGNFADEGPCAGVNPGRPIVVGSRPDGASPFGVHDLAGNVWEWIADAHPDHPDRRMVKGGSCCSFFVQPRASNRNAWAPDHRDGDLGFRCVGR